MLVHRVEADDHIIYNDYSFITPSSYNFGPRIRLHTHGHKDTFFEAVNIYIARRESY